MRTICLSLAAAILLAGAARAEEAPVYTDRAKLLIWKDAAGKEHPIKSAADWAKRRAHILANMEKVMGPLPDASRKVPLDIKAGDKILFGKYSGTDIKIDGEELLILREDEVLAVLG